MPKVVFKSKTGKKFTKTFKSASSASRAKAGWKAAGGKLAKRGR
jgi:hypothetical protein